LESGASFHEATGNVATARAPRGRLFLMLLFFACTLSLASRNGPCARAQDVEAAPSTPATSTPQSAAPQSLAPGNSQPTPTPQALDSCQLKNTGSTMTATGSMRALAVFGFSGVPAYAGATAVVTRVCIPHMPLINWYARFLNGPEVKPLTPREKADLAAHNLLDPFNLLTITGEAAISVAINPHSGYGPGIPGWGRYVGVSFTQDLTGEFFGTFLIPSLVHQDPHYHRMPNASIRRRIFHCIAQIAWTQGDDGRGMINYADLGGFAIDDEIGNLYVPGQQTRGTATAERYAIGLATAPIDNFVTEFLPDVARHVHIQVVIIQRVINQVARTENTAQ
jgi:hypothetical protein